MSIYNFVYNTATKEMSVTKDGVAMEGVEEVTLWKGWEEGKPFHMRLCDATKDKTEDTRVFTCTTASEIPHYDQIPDTQREVVKQDIAKFMASRRK